MTTGPGADGAGLRVTDLTVTYGDLRAVDGIDLVVAPGEVVVLLGPSGCGKSSVLRAVAGLEPCTGTITWDAEDIGHVRPDRRGFGMMFQEDVLFPHLDVAANVGFGCRMQGWAADATALRVEGVLATVGLPGLGDRAVDTLSGGQRQRVALARTIAPRPRLLMLDEPMSSVDRALRDQLVDDLPRVFAETGAAVLHVTHDQDEALALADRVVVMRDGRIEQDGPPVDVWSHPANAFVARFLASGTVVDAAVVGGCADTVVGEVAAGVLPDGPAAAVIPPDAVTLGAGGLTGTVVARRFAGRHVEVVVDLDVGVPMTLHADRDAPPVGTAVGVHVDRDRVMVVPA